MKEIALPENFVQNMTEAVELLWHTVRPADAALMDLYEALRNLEQYHQQECMAAISWARSARPNWYAIFHRTKKKRTRKKYLERIIREYRRNLEHGILEV